MPKLISTLLLLGLALTLEAQTEKTAIQQELESHTEKVRGGLSEIQTRLNKLEEGDSTRFTTTLIDSVYAAQRTLEDISYQIYSRTDYPVIAEDSTYNNMDSDSTGVAEEDSDTPSYPTYPPPGGGWKFKKAKSPRTILRIGFGFGFSDLAENSDKLAGTNYPNFDFDDSRFSSWQFLLDTRLGKRDTSNLFPGGFNPKKPWKRNDQFKDSKISLKIGVTLDRYRLAETSSQELRTVTENKEIPDFEPLGFDARENDITVRYITVPVVLSFKIGENLAVQGGVFAGIRTKMEQRITYGQGAFEFVRLRKDDFQTSKYTYGAIAGIGFDSFFLFGKFCLNPFFQENPVYDYRLFSYGLTISL